MFIVSRNENEVEFADAEFSYVSEVLKPIDASLSKLNHEISKADVWEVGCLCDEGEYLIGLGFCIMQRYMFDVLRDVAIKPKVAISAVEARKLGPCTSFGEPVAELIHTAANYWKHEPEWHIWLEKLSKQSQETIDRVLHHRDSAHYPLSDLLADLNNSSDLTLLGCLPYLIDWRKAVFEYTEKNV
ncbi:hypothetical protein [Vibrio cholerae]|uniref:hypothetical protein n=1 Tax=Vibrio cholerae TaxID=666 RepID=UPI000F0B30DC|nr:hypothetical protein [Vibrio cholerae]EGQ7791338.1 hypothetical protein [Vibrio cholerae]EGR1130082.1 hypothetical protein [Vibrio cholerae]EGR4344407.1 hypothetical protein [Vibrio cholerae]EHE6949512.1 hypothetical protein [Vibrio cholerae]EHS1094467.1 hypothetical protein [Vibrio cholerae]